MPSADPMSGGIPLLRARALQCADSESLHAFAELPWESKPGLYLPACMQAATRSYSLRPCMSGLFRKAWPNARRMFVTA